MADASFAKLHDRAWGGLLSRQSSSSAKQLGLSVACKCSESHFDLPMTTLQLSQKESRDTAVAGLVRSPVPAS